MKDIRWGSKPSQRFSVRISQVNADFQITSQSNQKFIAYPIRNYGNEAESKSLVNWIAELRIRDENDPDTTPPEKADWLNDVPKERFAGQFESWTFGFLDVPSLIAETEKVFEYPMCDRTPAPRWSFEALTLLGDAAHPMVC